MKLSESELRSACFDYAKAVIWDRKPTDVSEIQRFADAVFAEAMHHIEFIEGQNRNPNLVTYCVRYLELKHSIPPMRDDIRLVRNALEVLVELACPNQGITSDQITLFEEISHGMKEAESDAEST